MTCSNCGRKIKKRTDICPGCGEIVDDYSDLYDDITYEDDNFFSPLNIACIALSIVFIAGGAIYINSIVGIVLLISAFVVSPLFDFLYEKIFFTKLKAWIKFLIVGLLIIIGLIFNVVKISVNKPNNYNYDSYGSDYIYDSEDGIMDTNTESFSISIPEYQGIPYCVINNNVPEFSEGDIKHAKKENYEMYGNLDYLGRCTNTIACLNKDLMPTVERGSIGMVKPTGWHTIRYDNIDDEYLYNRCHLIGYQLTGQNANEKNLITGTRYMNVDGMLPFENKVANYLKSNPRKHVLYSVTPFYDGRDLVAKGVLMQAMSVEDDGEDLSFCVFCYNVQPGIDIDYRTGESSSKVGHVISVN